jgi:hypothetical protein
MDNTAEVIETKALAIPDQAQAIVVSDNDSMERANNFKIDIKAMIKEVDDWFKPLADKAFQSHRAITGKWNETKKPLQDADAYLTGQVKNYLAEVKRRQEEEERRLREIARKDEEERRLAEAEELEREGRKEEAEAILEEPITFVAPTFQVEMPRVDGRLYRTTTKVKVKNRLQFLKGVPAEVLLECINESAWGTIENALARKAKALGSAFKMQGVEVYQA